MFYNLELDGLKLNNSQEMRYITLKKQGFKFFINFLLEKKVRNETQFMIRGLFRFADNLVLNFFFNAIFSM